MMKHYQLLAVSTFSTIRKGMVIKSKVKKRGKKYELDRANWVTYLIFN